MIVYAKAFVKESPFVVYLADNIFPNGIGEFVKGFESFECDAKILLKKVENPERYGVAEIREES